MLNAGRIVYSVECLKDLLLLKKDWNILGTHLSKDENTITVGVAGEGLPEVMENELIPEVILTIKDKEIIEIRRK